jgi:hypothetical protein
MTPTVKFLFGFLVPHSIVTLRNQHRLRAMRKQRLANQACVPTLHASEQPYSYEAALEHLKHLGVDPVHLIAGSIPESSLWFVSQHLPRVARPGCPLTILHVGNFVGVSLCYITAACASLHAQSLVVAIDPNIKHRGVEAPQRIVTRLLSHFGLQHNVLLICGYSLKKNLADDGFVFQARDADIESRFADDAAPEDVLANLDALCGQLFDVAVLDGNHSGEYLEAELQFVLRLLKPEGLLVFDDVTSGWPEIRNVFCRLSEGDARNSGITDGRVGILYVTTGSAPAVAL